MERKKIFDVQGKEGKVKLNIFPVHGEAKGAR